MKVHYNNNGALASVTDPFTGQQSGYFYDCAGRLIGRGGAVRVLT